MNETCLNQDGGQGSGTAKPYYTARDVMQLLGVKKTKAYDLIKATTDDLKAKGELSELYPCGHVPAVAFDERYHIRT